MKIKKKSLLWLLLSFTLLFALVGCSVEIPQEKPSTGTSSKQGNLSENASLQVHYINVGQGDAILLQGKDATLLIDAGPRKSEETLLAYLKKQNIKKLDYVIATHPHEDHIGGMDDVISTYPIGKFYAPKKTTTTKTFEYMVKALQKKQLKMNVAKPGITFDLSKDIHCEILAPNSTQYEDVNNFSVVLKVTYKNTSFLFTGDAESLSEKEMITKQKDLSADVLKIGHHGSYSSTSSTFLKKVAPSIAVISCEKGNDYGHPHKETLEKLKQAKVKVYRTDLHGNIVLTSDGINIRKK